MNLDLDRLVDAIINISTKASTDQAVDLKSELQDVPVPVRIVLASVSLAAADRRMTGANLAVAGGFTRGSALRDYGELIAAIKAAAPHFVAAQLGPVREGPSVADLAAQLQQRNDTIAELRNQLRQRQEDLNTALSYARDLHEQLRPEFEAIAAEKKTKVRQLRPVDDTSD